jgi:hypothetical protein
MDDLVETLVIGLLVSLILIVIAWWFWKRFDQPSEAQIEREESIAKKKEETRMWRAVEAQMAQEQAELDKKALFEQRKAEERARAIPPPMSEVSNAFAAFGSQPNTTEPSHSESAEQIDAEPEIDDLDILEIPDLIEVRQDKGVVVEEGQQLPEIPLEAEPAEQPQSPEIEIPSAPNLDLLIDSSSELESQTVWPEEKEAESEDADWSDDWFGSLEQHQP